MKFGAIITAFFLLFSAVAISMPDYTDAARMGGGRSFGSKPFMNRSTTAPRQAQRQPGAVTAPQAGKTGMFGGMGGIFGGLLAGTLLGSLLSGNGFGGGGGFMDIILFAILAFVAWKLFQRFRGRQTAEPASSGPRGFFGNGFNQPMQRSDTAADGWSRLGASPVEMTAAQAQVDIPPGFDVDEFLKGAKMAYTRMQKSWDKRDLDDIAQFATPAVMTVLREQMTEDPNPGNTEIMLINAQLLGVEDEGADQRAQVYFDVLMRESPNQATPENAREVWHFLREGRDGMWKLDGIQQVD